MYPPIATLRARLKAATLGLALVALAPTAAADDVRTIEVTANEFGFTPSRIEVDQGRTVRLRLVNRGNLSHNVHLQGGGLKTRTVQGGASDTIEFTADEAGTVRFFCNVPGHQEAGMTGRLIVD